MVLKKHLLCWVVRCGDYFSSMLGLVKVDVCEIRKARLYDKSCSTPQSQSQTLSRELGDVGEVWTMAIVLWLPFSCYYSFILLQ